MTRRAAITRNGIVCAVCGYVGSDRAWPTYRCPKCGEPHVEMFKREHAAPIELRSMSDEELAEAIRGMDWTQTKGNDGGTET